MAVRAALRRAQGWARCWRPGTAPTAIPPGAPGGAALGGQAGSPQRERQAPLGAAHSPPGAAEHRPCPARLRAGRERLMRRSLRPEPGLTVLCPMGRPEVRDNQSHRCEQQLRKAAGVTGHRGSGRPAAAGGARTGRAVAAAAAAAPPPWQAPQSQPARLSARETPSFPFTHGFLTAPRAAERGAPPLSLPLMNETAVLWGKC